MKKTTIVVATGTLALALAAGIVAYGMHAGHGGRRGPGDFIAWQVDRMLDTAEATPDQRARIEGIVDPLIAQGGSLRDAHVAVHERLLSQWTAEKVDAAALHALADARLDEVRALMHRAVDGMVAVHDTLTPAQREQVRKEFEAFHAHAAKGHGPHGPAGVAH